MLVIQKLTPIVRKKSTDNHYTAQEISDYFKKATKQLMEDIKAIEQAERESWIKIRNGEIGFGSSVNKIVD